MSPSLSHFPDLCLLAMFKHIPLAEVIRTVGLVCKNWARVQREELKYRRSLVINHSEQSQIVIVHKENNNPYGSKLIEHVKREDGSPWMKVSSLDQTQFNCLKIGYNKFTTRFTDLVMNIMPNVTHLEVENLIYHVEPTVAFLEQMIRLIKHYSTKLISLTLHYQFGQGDRITGKVRNEYLNKMAALFGSINQLQALRHLKLDIISFDQVLSEMLPQVKLSILSRLNTFTTRFNNKFLYDSMREYATEISLSCGTSFTFDEMFKLNPRVKLTRVGLFNALVQNNYSEMHLFCTRFTSLQTLELSIAEMPMTMLARCLSQLPQLVHLKLDFGFIPENEKMSQLEIRKVPSVRLLTMYICFNSHLECERLHLAEIFPSIQVLSVYYYDVRCDKCGHDTSMMMTLDAIEPNLRARIEHCMSLARQPFRRCANLHTIKLDALGCLEDFLPKGLISVDQL